MARILVLAPSGFGKTTSWAGREKLGIKGLDPKETYVIQCIGRGVPNPEYKLCPSTEIKDIAKGNRINVETLTGLERFQKVAELLDVLKKSPFTNIVIDDFNYLMQDYYMDNALKGGWDTPKKIGYFMGKIFSAIEKYGDSDKNIIILAHGEEVPQQDGRIYMKMKTSGKMVDEYVTPEGKFDVTLVGRSRFDEGQKKIVKEFITNEDEFTSSPKSPYGMFPELYIPNYLGLVVAKVNEYYNG